MKVSFRKAILPRERNALAAFDRAVFRKADAFGPDTWDQLESYWMIADGRRVGCCAFARDVDFDSLRRPGSLYIVSTAILPRFQRRGYGDRLKRWQIAWARRRGFERIVTNSRRSNRPILRLNRKHGFRVIGVTRANYYSQPDELAVVMERRLPARQRILALLREERDRVDRAIEALTS